MNSTDRRSAIALLIYIKYTVAQKLKFLKQLAGDMFNVDNIAKLVRLENKVPNSMVSDLNVEELIGHFNELILAQDIFKAARILSDLAIGGSIEKAIAVASKIIKDPDCNEIRAISLWMIMHHKNMEQLIEVLSTGFRNNRFYTPNNARIIDAQGGEYLSIRAEGLSYSAVMANASDKFTHEINNAQQFNYKSSDAIDKIREVDANQVRPKLKSVTLSDTNALDLAFQTIGLTLGRIFGKSLWSGETIETCHSFVVQLDKTQQPYIFALFHDVEPWYLMIGTYKGTKNYIYLPERNIVILLRGLEHEWYKIDDYIRGFQGLSQMHCKSFNQYLNSETKQAIYSCGFSNLGHFFWNEVQGVFNVQRNGLFPYVEDAVLYKNQYVELAKLFPEFSLLNLHYPKSSDEVFICCIEKRLFCVHPTAFSMTSDCAALIRKVSWQLTDDITKGLIRETAKSDMKVWFNLRSHNKSWVNQIEGVTRIVNYLCSKYKSVTLVLDGFPDCCEIVEAIKKSLVEKNVRVIDCTATSLPNSISWAASVDFYVSTIGSGLCISTWIAEKPGVAHSETAHLGQIEMWKDVRQDIKIPLIPLRKQVVDLSDGAYCNYEIKPDVILSLVKKIA